VIVFGEQKLQALKPCNGYHRLLKLMLLFLGITPNHGEQASEPCDNTLSLLDDENNSCSRWFQL